jgi:HlyD family secretion protein/epimerase transport system membrane fusion protein
VPQEGDLIVEINIMPQDIDTVKVGQKAEVRFSALDLKVTPTVIGELMSVSPDVIYDPNMRMQYYLGKVRIPEHELVKVGGKGKLHAGMPSEVIVEAGERTLMAYLMRPLVNRFALSLKER